VEGIKKSIVQKNEILLSLDKAIARVSELAEGGIRKEETEHSVSLIIETLKNSMFFRDTKMLMKDKSSFYEFEVPDQIFEAGTGIQKEFMRGFADVAGSARWANRNRWSKSRVYLDVLNNPSNWKLPIQLCHLLQDYLNVPIDVIQWGHPNTRDPSLKEYKAGRKDAWAREHQIKDFKLFPDYQTYEIEVDIIGIIERNNGASLGMIECKLNQITLRDLSQDSTIRDELASRFGFIGEDPQEIVKLMEKELK